MRPGEKLHEQLISTAETARSLRLSGVEAAISRRAILPKLVKLMDRWAAGLARRVRGGGQALFAAPRNGAARRFAQRRAR